MWPTTSGTYSITLFSALSDGTYQVQSATMDSAANVSATSSSLVLYIDNASPVIGTVSSVSVDEGETFSISVPFTDASPQSQSRTATINWGDSSTSVGTVSFSAGSGTVTGTYLYGYAGSYTLTVTVTDQENMSGNAQGTATVINTPPVIEIGTDSTTLNSGYNGMTVAVITDGIYETHTGQIAWGDGTVDDATIQGTNVFGSHTYLLLGTYTAIFTVTDSQGVQASDSVIFTVTGPNAEITIPSAGVWGLSAIALTIFMLFMFKAYRRKSRSIL